MQNNEHKFIKGGEFDPFNSRVAEGVAHFYPRLGSTMEWDTAAAHVVMKYVGGKVCNLNGIELCYNKTDLHNPEFFVLSTMDNKMLAQVKENILD